MLVIVVALAFGVCTFGQTGVDDAAHQRPVVPEADQ